MSAIAYDLLTYPQYWCFTGLSFHTELPASRGETPAGAHFVTSRRSTDPSVTLQQVASRNSSLEVLIWL